MGDDKDVFVGKEPEAEEKEDIQGPEDIVDVLEEEEDSLAEQVHSTRNIKVKDGLTQSASHHDICLTAEEK